MASTNSNRGKLRIVFFGTAELACASLNALAQHPEFLVLGVVTQPDRPRGRALKLQPTPVKAAATQLGLPVWQPARCREASFVERLGALEPDLIVVAAYGQILPQALLRLPPHGCLNVHASLLPRHRGAAPIQWAILSGDAETGVTIMQMDVGLDTGDTLSCERTPIRSDDTGQTLHDRLAAMGGALLVRTIPDYVSGRLLPRPQPAEGITYARKITKEDGRLDWRLPALELWNRVRAFTPWPGAFTFLTTEEKRALLKLWRVEPLPDRGGRPGEIITVGPDELVVACGEGALRVTEVQREGGRRLAVRDFLAGHPLERGPCF